MADYGTDLSCVTDLANDSRVVSGFVVVGEALARRLSTPRGRLINDPNYGLDLSQYINADMSARDIAALRAAIVAECVKDERVNPTTSCTAVLDLQGVLTVTIQVVLSDAAFTLVVAASEVTVALVSVEP